jgi:predicted ArsR family transcriptional regulator
MTDTNRSDPTAGRTRARLLALLREGEWTVDDLAGRLDLTDNAVRFHLDALVRAGTVARSGLRRGKGAGQPAVFYSLASAAEESFSRAYAPVLIALVEELGERMSPAQLMTVLKRTGKRIGGSAAHRAGSLLNRVKGASELLNSLGGVTSIEKSGTNYRIVGRACPLSSAVEANHCVCAAVTSLVAEVVNAEVMERCDRSGRPKCCFEISSDKVARAIAHG